MKFGNSPPEMIEKTGTDYKCNFKILTTDISSSLVHNLILACVKKQHMSVRMTHFFHMKFCNTVIVFDMTHYIAPPFVDVHK